MTSRAGIGLGRRLDIGWLDAVAAQVAAGAGLDSIRATLFDLLDGQLTGGTRRGSACHATVGVLARIWVTVPTEIAGFRDRAVQTLPTLSPRERLTVHWSMLLAGYPFFGDLASNAGRLLSLQGNFATPQITRRMQESWGERGTVERATQCVVQSMVQWGVLVATTRMGVHVETARRTAANGRLAKLLLEGLLIHEGNALPVEQAVRHPAFFPFDVSLRAHDLRQSPGFEVHRQGLDVDVVDLVEGGGGMAPVRGT